MYLYASLYNISSLLLLYQHQRFWSSQVRMKTSGLSGGEWVEEEKQGMLQANFQYLKLFIK